MVSCADAGLAAFGNLEDDIASLFTSSTTSIDVNVEAAATAIEIDQASECRPVG